MKTRTPDPVAALTFSSPSYQLWRVGKYRVSTYPDSDLVYIVLAEKTSKRIIGHKVEAMVRSSINEAKQDMK